MIFYEMNLQMSITFGFGCPTIHDSSVDFCVEVAVVTLADYSLETPQ